MLSREWCSTHYWRWHSTGDPLTAMRPKLAKNAYTTCTVDGCDRPHWSRGYCEMHARRVRETGDPGPATPIKNRKRTPKEPCEVDGCDRPKRGRHHCHLHQERLRRTGGVGPVKPLQVKGTGTLTKEGYRRLYVDGRRVLEHVAVMEEHLGRRLAPGENVHHLYGDVTDNRIEHLELWFKMQPSGQRVSDLIKFIAEYHRDAMVAALTKESHGRSKQD